MLVSDKNVFKNNELKNMFKMSVCIVWYEKGNYYTVTSPIAWITLIHG